MLYYITIEEIILSEKIIILFKVMRKDFNRTHMSLAETQLIAVSNNRKVDTLMCKICHGDDSSVDQLQGYCNCKEKYCYAHANCLKVYLQNKINKSLEIQAGSQQALICEKCLDSYKVQCNVIRKCSGVQKIKKNVQRKSFLFGVCIIGLVISIIVIAACSSLLKRSSSNSSSPPSDQNGIIIAFIIFSSLLFPFFIFKIIEKFFTHRLATVSL